MGTQGIVIRDNFTSRDLVGLIVDASPWLCSVTSKEQRIVGYTVFIHFAHIYGSDSLSGSVTFSTPHDSRLMRQVR